MMKVVAINGSPHKDGNTAAALAVMKAEWRISRLAIKFRFHRMQLLPEVRR